MGPLPKKRSLRHIPVALRSGHPWPPRFLGRGPKPTRSNYRGIGCKKTAPRILTFSAEPLHHILPNSPPFYFSIFLSLLLRVPEGLGGRCLPKICGAMDGGAEAPQGCAVRSGFWSPLPPRIDLHPNLQATSNPTPKTARQLYAYR